MCRRGMLFLALFGGSNPTSCRIPTVPHQKKYIEAPLGAYLLIEHFIPIEFEKAFNERKLNYIHYLRIS